MAQHLYTYDDPPSPKDIQKIVQTLNKDGVIAYPTDLNWALACDATSVHGLERLRRLKPQHKKKQPLSLVFSSISMAAEYVYINNAAYRLLRKIWPGPYTVLLTSVRTLPRQLKDKRKVIGVRIPSSPLIHAVIDALGRPLASTSIPTKGFVVDSIDMESTEDEELDFLAHNDESQEGMGQGKPERFSPSNDTQIPFHFRFGYEIEESLGHALDLVVDLGHELPGLDSTIIDLTADSPTIVRRGAGDVKILES